MGQGGELIIQDFPSLEVVPVDDYCVSLEGTLF
jgi:hypothetical protein